MDTSIRLMPCWRVAMTFADGSAHNAEAHGKTGEEAVYHAMRAFKPVGLLQRWTADPLDNPVK